MAKQPKGTVEHIDPETGEVTYITPPPIEDAEIIPEGEDDGAGEYERKPAPKGELYVAVHTGEAGEGPQLEPATEEPVDPDFADLEPAEGIAEPEHIHAYDAGEFNPEIQKLEGQIRNFLLDRIKNNWKPWQQMTVDEQQQLVNAVEQQARDTIRGTVRAVNNYEWAHCTVVLGQVTLKGGDKGIEAKITCSNVDENRNFLGEHVDKHVLILSTDAETFFGARDKVKYDGRNSQMDLPLGGNVKDIEAGGFAAEEEAIRAPVLDGPEPDAFAPEGEDDEQPASDLSADDDEDKTDPAPWPDDEQLGERPADSSGDPGEA
jgi:hypothetical protein